MLGIVACARDCKTWETEKDYESEVSLGFTMEFCLKKNKVWAEEVALCWRVLAGCSSRRPGLVLCTYKMAKTNSNSIFRRPSAFGWPPWVPGIHAASTHMHEIKT